MAYYQRKTLVNAVPFYEKEFEQNPLSYPDVWDMAMTYPEWKNKTAKDGRFYLMNQPNTHSGQTEYITVNNGDYILREEMGIVHTLPKEVFERHFVVIPQESM